MLGLDPESEPTEEDIKKAYRKKSLATHPDKNPVSVGVQGVVVDLDVPVISSFFHSPPPPELALWSQRKWISSEREGGSIMCRRVDMMLQARGPNLVVAKGPWACRPQPVLAFSPPLNAAFRLLLFISTSCKLCGVRDSECGSFSPLQNLIFRAEHVGWLRLLTTTALLAYHKRTTAVKCSMAFHGGGPC